MTVTVHQTTSALQLNVAPLTDAAATMTALLVNSVTLDSVPVYPSLIVPSIRTVLTMSDATRGSAYQCHVAMTTSVPVAVHALPDDVFLHFSATQTLTAHCLS